MNISMRKVGGIVIVKLPELLTGMEYSVLGDLLSSPACEGCGHYILDLSEVRYLGGSALRSFLRFGKEVREQRHGQVLLAEMSRVVEKTCYSGGIFSHIDRFPTVHDALVALRASVQCLEKQMLWK